MTTYTDHDQRLLDQKSAAEMDRKGIPTQAITPHMVSIPLAEYEALKACREMVVELGKFVRALGDMT